MVKQRAKDVKKELEEDQKEVYGETSISGSMPDPSSDDDVDSVVKEITGEEPKEGEPFSLAKEVDEDEKARRTKPEENERE